MGLQELDKIYTTIFNKQQPIALNSFNEEMSISQVIKFFGKYEIHLTKTMIQNYIRIGLLPGPIEKRYYIKDHLILLFLIYTLKESFSLEELRVVFSPILQDTTTFEDDLVSPTTLYDIYIQMQSDIEKKFKTDQVASSNQVIEEIMKSLDVEDNQTPLIKQFMLVLYTMLETVTLRQLSISLMDNFFRER
jgi:DNA-binding transcriptional MerR regulator